jgi:transglutaminase-like putative cysteine protease
MTLDRRMTLTASLAVVLASTVIFPLFSGSTWFYAGIGAVITVAAFGTLSRLRTLPVIVCLAITLAGLLLYLNVTFEASRSLLKFIPTGSSLTALGSLLHAGMDEASKYAPGAPNVAGLVLLAAGGIGITAVFTDLIAVRLRSTALAGLPLLVLFTVPVTMSTGRSQLATTVIFCLGTSGYLAMLSADGRERIRVWGRLISLWRTHDGDLKEFGGTSPNGRPAAHTGPAGNSASSRIAVNGDNPASAARSAYRVLRGPDTRALAAAGRRVGLASVVLALFAPLLVPGLHAGHLLSSGWGFGTGSGGGTVTLPDPLSATASQLRESRSTTVLTYTTNASPYLQAYYPQYLQQYVYDKLTDQTSNPWQLFSNGTTTQQFGTTLPPEAGLTNTAAAPEVKTSITIPAGATNPASGINFLPVPYPPVRLTGQRGTWWVDPATLMLVTKDGSLAGQSYQVTSHDMDPTGQDLGKVPTGPAGIDTQLPADYKSEALLRLAVQHTAGAKSQFAEANDLATWLGRAFSYNLYAPPISSPESLLQFLTKSQTGDCVQFSYAFTVLARLLGIPTRLATGYTEGVASPANSSHYVVKSGDAHAWPEVYFQGYGWIRFEPTPQGQGTAQAPGYNQPSATSLVPPALPPGQTTTTPAGGSSNSGKLKQIGNSGNGIGGIAARPSAPTPWTAILLAVLAAIAVAGGVIALAAPTAARALSSRAESPRQRGRLSIATAFVAVVAAGIVALALYRLMSRTTGLDLSTGWATVGIAFGAAAAAALALPTAGRVVLRRWRWVRAGDDASRAHAAWHELRADLADFGVGYLPSESPRALASRVTSRLELPESASAAVTRIALAEERATYAGRPAESETLRQDGSTARHAIAAASSRGARWRSRMFPASVMTAMADTATRVTDSWTSRGWLRWSPDRT